MKRIVFTLALSTLLTSSFASCLTVHKSPPTAATGSAAVGKDGTGTVTVNRLRNFDGVDVSQGITLRHVPGGQRSVTVTAAPKDLKHVRVYVDEGELKVGLEPGQQNIKATVTVTGYNLREYEASSGASVIVTAPVDVRGKLSIDASSGSSVKMSGIKAGTLDVDASSGAAITLTNIAASTVEAEASSGAQVTLSGRTDRAEFDAGSGGEIRAEKLVAQRGKVDAGSGGTVNCNVKRLILDDDNTGTVRNVVKR